MSPRLAFAASLGIAALAVSAPSSAAPAGPKDAAALKLDADAMAKDYLDTQFAKAKTKLDQAIAACGKSGCSPKVLARLHRDLGVVLVAGLNKPADGKKAFAKAREIDPAIALDKDYTTPAIKKLWAESGKGGAGKGAPAVDEPKIGHTPVTEQEVNRPLPIYATIENADANVQMQLWYEGPGATTWSHLTMNKRGEGYAGEVPCSATATTGDLSYFIQARAADGEAVAKSGSREEPLKVELKKELAGEAPHLPDAEAPKRCGADETAAPVAPAPTGERKNWFFVTFQQDLSLIGSGSGICTQNIQGEGNWSCFRSDGTQYRGNPVHGKGDDTTAGISFATTRLHAGYDRVLVGGLTGGVRAGAAIRGGAPTSTGSVGHGFLPLYLEARAAYWFGSDPFATAGFRPFLFVGTGVASVDTGTQIPVKEDRSVPSSQKNPSSQTLDAYRSMGDGFFGGGLGLMYAITPGFGVLADVRFARLFPRGGNALLPELAVGFGL